MTAQRGAWFYSHDIRPDQVDSVVLPGWRLVRLSSYGSGPARRFAALVDNEAGPARGYWLDLDAPTLAARLRESGVRPVAITAGVDEPPRFSVVFETAPVPGAGVRVDLDESGLRGLVDDGHRVVDLATYLDDGARRFAAVVEEGSGPSWLFLAVEPDELDSGLRERDVAPRFLRCYRDAGGLRLVAVAEHARDTRWFAGLDGDGVGRELERNGARPVDLDATRDGGDVRFTVVMRRDDIG